MKLTIPEDRRFGFPENTFDVFLIDDGTLDTVIEIDGIEHRLDIEYASHYRDESGAMTETGLTELAKQCIEECEEHWQ